jgi:hypothetical protein
VVERDAAGLDVGPDLESRVLAAGLHLFVFLFGARRANPEIAAGVPGATETNGPDFRGSRISEA